MGKIKKLLSSKVAQNSLWMLLLQGFNTVIPLFTLPYITRILSTSTYGQFSIALNWVGYFQVLVEYGFGLSGARRVATAKSKDEIETFRSSIMCARIVLTFLCILFFLGIIFVTGVDENQIACMAILFLMVVSIVFQQNWYFQGIAEMNNIVVINVISRSVSVILIFLCVKGADDLHLYCFLYISTFMISSFIGCLIVRFKYGLKLRIPSICSIKRELVEGWPLFVSSAMTKIFGSIGVTILGFVSTDEVVGIYSAINKIPYIMTILFGAISQVIYPYSCKAFEKSFANGLKKVKKYATPVLVIFSLGSLAIMICNKFIVTIAFGADYVNSSTLLIPFALWVLFGIINNFLGIQILVASGHQKEYSLSFTISCITLFVMMFALGHFFGAYGIAFASMFSEMLLSCILESIICKIRIK